MIPVKKFERVCSDEKVTELFFLLFWNFVADILSKNNFGDFLSGLMELLHQIDSVGRQCKIHESTTALGDNIYNEEVYQTDR